MQLPFSLPTFSKSQTRNEQIGTVILLLAGLVVAVAIATDGAVSRAINGVSGILWFAAAGLLLRSLRGEDGFWTKLAQVTGICLLLVLFLRPSDLAFALTGFSAAGAIIAATTGRRGFTWATLLPALWLPVHLLTAVAKAVYRAIRDQDAALRSDPPPTAAIVPFSMIVGAMIGAWLVRRFILDRPRSS